MKKITRLSLFLLSLLPFRGFSQLPNMGTNPKGGGSWIATKPFQRDVFIENNGQFSAAEKKFVGSKINYFTHKGSVYLYFTPNGLALRKDTVYKVKGEDKIGIEQEDGMRDLRIKHMLTKMQFVGANPNAKIVVENETPDYFTYPNHQDKSGKSSVLAHAWTKLIYKNIYKGIDIEFYYPEDKGGIEYNIIVHPGGDPSVVKFSYSGSNCSLNGNNLEVATGWDKIIDHAPTAKDANGHTVSAAFGVNGNTVSFHVGNYDKSQTLVIDPWMTLTTLGGSNLGYDIGYDYLGNVYVYGGGVSGYYELQKYNSGGGLVWTYTNNAFTYLYVTGYFYGGMVTDHKTGTSYMCEGFDPSPGCMVVKVNYNGTQAALFNGNSGTDEMWHMEYDYCNDQLLIVTGGSPTGQQCCHMDTNCTTESQVNMLSLVGVYSDQTLIGTDNAGQCYVATSQMVFPSGYSNLLCKMPLPSMTPTAYNVYDKHNFIEITNISYYPVLSGYVVGNGFNGLVATPTFVVTYDGGKMRQWKASNGALFDSATVSGTSYAWGGLDIDCQGHIYCGNNNAISIYDSNMNPVGNIPLSNTVYDLLVAPNGNIYACGNGYVQCVSGAPKLVTATYTPAGCACTGSATAHPCGPGPFSYLWSNGATTSSITNMCSGTYTVTVWEGTCPKPFDTAIVNLGAGGGFAATVTTVNASSSLNGSATAVPTGGHPPYTYKWSDNTTNVKDTGLIAGNYYVLIWDSTGCKDSIAFTITSSGAPTIKVTPTNDSICNGGSDSLVASGGQTYSWLPTTGLSCTTCANPIASPTITTIYTVTGDSNGCKATATATVTVLPPPTIKVSASPDTVCSGNPTTVTASGGVTYKWSDGSTTSSITVKPIVMTTYTVIGFDAHGCSNAATVTIYVASAPNLTVSVNKSICPGQSVTLSASGVGSGYNWQPGNNTSQTITVSPTSTTTYTVTLSDGCGIATGNVTVNVNPMPNTKITADVMAGCAPLCIQFRNTTTISSGTITQYNWAFGNGDTLNEKNPVYCYPNPGSYNITMTAVSDSGCSATLKVLNMINVYSHPNANFTVNPQPTTIMQPTIEFGDKSTDAYGITYWNWTFGDALDSVQYTQNASHTYGDTGTYCATLTIVNQHGCADTMTNCLIISPIYCLYIPDAFSPNGDGKNEFFTAKGNDVISFEMYIFDRWGMQLFHSTDINDGWNGRVRGGSVICQEDTYVYLINVYDSKKAKHSYTGTVNLLK